MRYYFPEENINMSLRFYRLPQNIFTINPRHSVLMNLLELYFGYLKPFSPLGTQASSWTSASIFKAGRK